MRLNHAAAAAMLAGLASTACVRRDVTATASVPAVMQRHAANAWEAGDRDLVLDQLRRRVVAEPSNIPLRLSLAKHYERMDARELAAEHFRAALEHVPASRDAAIGLARNLRRLGMNQEALNVLDRAAQTPGPLAELHSWQGLLHDEAGRWAEGEKALRQALAESGPRAQGRDALHNNLGFNLLKQNRAAEAVREFEQALALRPDSAVARNNLATANAMLGDPAARKKAMLHWLSTSSTASAHNNLAAILMEQGRYEDARKELHAALSSEPGHSAALHNLALLTKMDGQPGVLPGIARKSGSVWSTLRRALVGESLGEAR